MAQGVGGAKGLDSVEFGDDGDQAQSAAAWTGEQIDLETAHQQFCVRHFFGVWAARAGWGRVWRSAENARAER